MPYCCNGFIFVYKFYIVDQTDPVCQAIAPVNEVIPLNQGGTTVRFTEPQATDNSGTVTLRSRSHSPGQFFPTGSTQVCYTFADPSGNTADCCFDVVVTEGKYVPKKGRI